LLTERLFAALTVFTHRPRERVCATALGNLYSFYRTYANGVLPVPHLR
jgi:hypothetical protein